MIDRVRRSRLLQGGSLEFVWEECARLLGQLFSPCTEVGVRDYEQLSKMLTGGQAYVEHGDSFAMRYGDLNNTDWENQQISLTRRHFFAVQDITVDDYLPAVECPRNYIPGMMQSILTYS
jgi:hypothetical protein